MQLINMLRTLFTFQVQRTTPSSALFDDWGDDGEFLDDDLDWSPARNTPPPPPYTEGPKDDLGQFTTDTTQYYYKSYV